jgi:ATP-dependent DNA helicase RecG
VSNPMTGSGIPFQVRVAATVASRARTQDESRSESGQSRGSESGQSRRPKSLVADAGAPTEIRVLSALTDGPLARSGVVSNLGQKSLSGAIRKAVSVLLRDEWIEYTVPDKPNSRLQKYRLTQAGEQALREWTGGN